MKYIVVFFHVGDGFGENCIFHVSGFIKDDAHVNAHFALCLPVLNDFNVVVHHEVVAVWNVSHLGYELNQYVTTFI